MTKWKRASGAGGTAFCLLSVWGLLACGGAAKSADSPANCPAGTVLHGSDCLPADALNDAPASGDSTSQTPPGNDATGSGAGAPTASGGGGEASTETSTPYDRDAVEAELKRGARQVKANCGAATDENGQAIGPWGRTKASVVLGRNGHVKQVTVPAPYDGKPVGLCVVHSFDKIQFPPYAGGSDVTVDWDVDIVAPKH